ncbi:uncharacterized protein [Euphorbia lathyris]|uniref:uncharacterized protein n=1 Tax=Euphorbia lathyris TaxID=212925 RepID=UPI0033139F6C
MTDFDLMMGACAHPFKTEPLKSAKNHVLFCYQSYVTEKNVAVGLAARIRSNMAELESYSKKFNALVDAEEADRQRLAKIAAVEERLLVLEKEVAEARASKVEMVRASSGFRACFPRMEEELAREKDRLANHYDEMLAWHRQSEQHKEAASKLCESWAKYPKPDFCLFP